MKFKKLPHPSRLRGDTALKAVALICCISILGCLALVTDKNQGTELELTKESLKEPSVSCVEATKPTPIKTLTKEMYFVKDYSLNGLEYKAQEIVDVDLIGEQFYINGELISRNFIREYDPELHLNISLEYEYQDLIRELIDLMNIEVDEYFFYGLMYSESRFNHQSISSVEAKGIMQITPLTWYEAYNKFCSQYPEFSETITNDIWDKRSNITIGVFIVHDLSTRLGGLENGNEHRILTSYNRGTTGTNNYYSSKGTYVSSYSENVLRAGEYIQTHKTWKEGI